MSHEHQVHEAPRAAELPPQSETERVSDPVCGMRVVPEHEPVAPVPTEWVCPMHPQIVRDAPGTCPICGMALEPRTVSAEETPELRDMRRRFWVSAALTVPLVLAAMVEMIGLDLGRYLPARAMAWIQLALATPVVVWGGAPFFARGWRSIVNRSLNMFTLIALGVVVAYAFSIVAVLAPSVVPMTFRMAARCRCTSSRPR